MSDIKLGIACLHEGTNLSGHTASTTVRKEESLIIRASGIVRRTDATYWRESQIVTNFYFKLFWLLAYINVPFKPSTAQRTGLLVN
jgi:hypothetical protein